MDNEITLLLAECYPLINTSKGMQDVCVDAHLSPTADRVRSFDELSDERQICSERTYHLPQEECQRIQTLAQTRDLNQIRSELDGLFLGKQPSSEEMPAFNEAAQDWIGNGLVAFRKGGRQALQDYTVTLDDWIRKLRRRGDIKRVHGFLNMFSYECKVDFYTCYCSAWAGIMQHLEQHGEPNIVGNRFMRMWHNQNQGRQETENQRDVFCGQVLALHPLSAVMFTSPEPVSKILQSIADTNVLNVASRFALSDTSLRMRMVQP